MAKKPKASAPKGKTLLRLANQPIERGQLHLYTLEVFLISGFITEKFSKKNPLISRTILIRGDQTLEQLHEVIFEAFDRFDEHLYEFQFGKGPMDSPRYVLSMAADGGHDKTTAGFVEKTTIESLGLEKDRAFGYWFDFGDDWWHQINVLAIEPGVPPGKYPSIVKRVGKSPPQYPEEEE